ncbi:MAG: hypothetical protein ABIH85_06215 [Candidatus Omnitrophota bacterium]
MEKIEKESFLNNSGQKKERKWYFSPGVICLAILAGGPLALPLLWFRPKTNVFLKVALSLIVMGFTAFITMETIGIYKSVIFRCEELSQVAGSARK